MSHFSSFAEISVGAMDRISRLSLPKEKVDAVSKFFFGVREPEYSEVSYEQAFRDLQARAEKYLDVYELNYRKHIRKRGINHGSV